MFRHNHMIRITVYFVLMMYTNFHHSRTVTVHAWILRNSSPLPPLLHELYVWKNEDRPSPSSPLPVMPSLLFQDLALSQMELLLYSLNPSTSDSSSATSSTTSKVKSIALYLPQENARTGQLEFLPALICPPQERVFIANEWQSGIPPALPKAALRLPGFAHATTLLPRYPMLRTTEETDEHSSVEEVVCDWPSGTTALSVPLLLGSHTVGVLLVSPQQTSSITCSWTTQEKAQVARAAQSLSLALQMDTERQQMQQREQQQLDAWSDQVHQLKNPIQALRTYGKLLQRRMVELSRTSGSSVESSSEQEELLALTDRLLQQSDRIVERLPPIDALTTTPWVLQPAPRNETIASGLAWTVRPQLLPAANRTEVEENTNRFGNLPQLWMDQASSLSFRNDTRDTPNSCAHDVGYEKEMKKDWPMSFVTDILEPIFETYRVLAEDRQISFSVDTAPEEDLPGIPVDPHLLQEILVNLLDNAFKYSSVATDSSAAAASPQVRVRILPNDDPPGVRIRVEDNGPGIAESDRAQVFDRGFRSPRLSQQVPGTGLGLSVAQSYAQRLGGTLRVVDDAANALPGAVLELTLFRLQKRGKRV